MARWLLPFSLIALSFIPPGYAKDHPAFCSSQIVAHSRESASGYTWTLASRLGKILGMAEAEYGERDKSWTLLGVEFNDATHPRHWYPFEADKNIIIQLTKHATNNEKKAFYQLSHEVFHILSPQGGGKKSTYFEEGLATYFSIKATQKAGFNISPNYIGVGKYRKAYDLVKALYKAHADTGKRVAEFRKLGAHYSTLNQAQLMIIFPNIEATLAKQLAEKF